MDYNLAVLHENTVKIKLNPSLSQDFLGGGGRIFKKISKILPTFFLG